MSECPDCGGATETEVDGSFEDERCQDCGRVVGGGRLVEDSPTETLTCPFADCDWSYESTGDYYSEIDAEFEAEGHYEAEHAGKVRVKVTLERDQLLGARDISDVTDHAHDDWEDTLEEEFLAWDLAYVGAEIVEEPDDHGKCEMETQDD